MKRGSLNIIDMLYCSILDFKLKHIPTADDMSSAVVLFFAFESNVLIVLYKLDVFEIIEFEYIIIPLLVIYAILVILYSFLGRYKNIYKVYKMLSKKKKKMWNIITFWYIFISFLSLILVPTLFH